MAAAAEAHDLDAARRWEVRREGESRDGGGRGQEAYLRASAAAASRHGAEDGPAEVDLFEPLRMSSSLRRTTAAARVWRMVREHAWARRF
jgi:hypothetical protein